MEKQPEVEVLRRGRGKYYTQKQKQLGVDKQEHVQENADWWRTNH